MRFREPNQDSNTINNPAGDRILSAPISIIADTPEQFQSMVHRLISPNNESMYFKEINVLRLIKDINLFINTNKLIETFGDFALTIFGSRVRGNFTYKSDLDVAVIHEGLEVLPHSSRDKLLELIKAKIGEFLKNQDASFEDLTIDIGYYTYGRISYAMMASVIIRSRLSGVNLCFSNAPPKHKKLHCEIVLFDKDRRYAKLTSRAAHSPPEASAPREPIPFVIPERRLKRS